MPIPAGQRLHPAGTGAGSDPAVPASPAVEPAASPEPPPGRAPRSMPLSGIGLPGGSVAPPRIGPPAPSRTATVQRPGSGRRSRRPAGARRRAGHGEHREATGRAVGPDQRHPSRAGEPAPRSTGSAVRVVAAHRPRIGARNQSEVHQRAAASNRRQPCSVRARITRPLPRNQAHPAGARGRQPRSGAPLVGEQQRGLLGRARVAWRSTRGAGGGRRPAQVERRGQHANVTARDRRPAGGSGSCDHDLGQRRRRAHVAPPAGAGQAELLEAGRLEHQHRAPAARRTRPELLGRDRRRQHQQAGRRAPARATARPASTTVDREAEPLEAGLEPLLAAAQASGRRRAPPWCRRARSAAAPRARHRARGGCRSSALTSASWPAATSVPRWTPRAETRARPSRHLHPGHARSATSSRTVPVPLTMAWGEARTRPGPGPPPGTTAVARPLGHEQPDARRAGAGVGRQPHDRVPPQLDPAAARAGQPRPGAARPRSTPSRRRPAPGRAPPGGCRRRRGGRPGRRSPRGGARVRSARSRRRRGGRPRRPGEAGRRDLARGRALSAGAAGSARAPPGARGRRPVAAAAAAAPAPRRRPAGPSAATSRERAASAPRRRRPGPGRRLRGAPPAPGPAGRAALASSCLRTAATTSSVRPAAVTSAFTVATTLSWPRSISPAARRAPSSCRSWIMPPAEHLVALERRRQGGPLVGRQRARTPRTASRAPRAVVSRRLFTSRSPLLMTRSEPPPGGARTLAEPRAGATASCAAYSRSCAPRPPAR